MSCEQPQLPFRGTCAFLPLLLFLLAAPPVTLVAQQPAQQYPTVSLSGIVFGHYLYRTDEAGDGINRFDIERAELSALGRLAERTRYRVSMDVVPPPAAVAGQATTGWVIRARYAFVDHDLLRAARGVTLSGRIGMIHNVIIGTQEAFWPRWVHRSPVDRAGYFSSSDLGAGVQLTLPSRIGSAYATVMNGPGIGSPEVDRYKDVAARLTITPLASRVTPLRSLAATLWFSNGAIGSRFATGGPGQEGPVDARHRRDRWGVHLGLDHPIVLAGTSWSTRTDDAELGANTAEDPRRVEERMTDLLSVHAHLRPARLVDADAQSSLGILSRWDRASGFQPSDFFLAGVSWDLAPRTAVAVLRQSQQPRDGSPIARIDAWLLQFTFGF